MRQSGAGARLRRRFSSSTFCVFLPHNQRAYAWHAASLPHAQVSNSLIRSIDFDPCVAVGECTLGSLTGK